jgi:ABC-2 type transport system permease protein
VTGSRQAGALVARLFDDLLAAPATIMGALAFPPAFLLIQDALLARSGSLGSDPVAFLTPTAVMLGVLVAGAAGFAVHRDAEDGYLERLMTMPVSRTALVAAPVAVGVGYALAETVVLLTLAGALGAMPTAGPGGLAVILLIAALWATVIASYTTAAALLTRQVEVLRIVDVAFVPLVFLAPALAVRGEMKGWLETVSSANPVTYAIEAQRALMVGGWQWHPLALGLGVSVAAAAIAFAAAVTVARRTLARELR